MRLERLAEAHVVGEHGAELRVAQEAQPVDAPALVGPQRRREVRGSAAGGMPTKPSASGAQPCEPRRRGRSRASQSWASAGSAARVTLAVVVGAASRSATR
jgi:hypothetical protein